MTGSLVAPSASHGSTLLDDLVDLCSGGRGAPSADLMENVMKQNAALRTDLEAAGEQLKNLTLEKKQTQAALAIKLRDNNLGAWAMSSSPLVMINCGKDFVNMSIGLI